MTATRYEVSKLSARLWITVQDGIVTRAESPTHGCFDANFVGMPWEQVRTQFEEDGFTVHGGT